MENAIKTKAKVMAKTCDTIKGDVKDAFVLFFRCHSHCCCDLCKMPNICFW